MAPPADLSKCDTVWTLPSSCSSSSSSRRVACDRFTPFVGTGFEVFLLRTSENLPDTSAVMVMMLWSCEIAMKTKAQGLEH